MSWFKLAQPMGEEYNANPRDIVNTKKALNQIGYYQQPFGGGFGDWVDNDMFHAIRRFQKDHRLEVDGIMRPGGPTEAAINHKIASFSFGSPLFVDGYGSWPVSTNYVSFSCNTPCATPPKCGQNPCVACTKAGDDDE